MPKYLVHVFRECKSSIEVQAESTEAAAIAAGQVHGLQYEILTDPDHATAFLVDVVDGKDFGQSRWLNGAGQDFDGSECPHCRSENITGGPVEVEGNGAHQRCGCEDCGAEWDQIFKTTQYMNLLLPEEKDGAE